MKRCCALPGCKELVAPVKANRAYFPYCCFEHKHGIQEVYRPLVQRDMVLTTDSVHATPAVQRRIAKQNWKATGNE